MTRVVGLNTSHALCHSYTFSFPDSESIAGGKAASALLTKASDPQALLDDKGKPVIRPYTPISHVRLLVKEYPVSRSCSVKVDS
jgi:cytochrome-b5 reductase